ncbi:MAG TPA: hypothetical protein VLV87_03930 [Gammaproteobacteria bacterium]|nr:hypothetical protein [Gammaproteobacteria bacterium]
MKRIRIYRNADCPKCARYARLHQRLDWSGRVEVSTAVPPTGPLAMGEVLVQELDSGRMLRGLEAARRITQVIPVYAPIRLLLRIPALARAADREMRGCSGACELPSRRA